MESLAIFGLELLETMDDSASLPTSKMRLLKGLIRVLSRVSNPMSCAVWLKHSLRDMKTLKNMKELSSLPISMLKLLHWYLHTIQEQTRLCFVTDESGQVSQVLYSQSENMEPEYILVGAMKDTDSFEIWIVNTHAGCVYLSRLKSRQSNRPEQYLFSQALLQEYISLMGNTIGESLEWTAEERSLKRFDKLDIQ